jgi:putative hydrolase of the HAD superfamily
VAVVVGVGAVVVVAATVDVVEEDDDDDVVGSESTVAAPAHAASTMARAIADFRTLVSSMGCGNGTTDPEGSLTVGVSLPSPAMTARPHAVLLDVGGVFHMPLRATITAAMTRAGYEVTDRQAIDRAHFVAIGVFPLDFDVHSESFWHRYLKAYAGALGVAGADIEDVQAHLEPEFTTVALWAEIVDGSREGLEALKDTGVEVGIVSNADGSVEQRLREQEILQVGPGLGVEVRCVVDSGQVGVSKPDPRIFRIALDALDVPADDTWYVGDSPAIDVVGARRAGIHPILMDPFQLRGDLGVTRAGSLHEVAAMVDRSGPG